MSFPRYSSYQPTGVQWMKEIPAHWTLSRLGRATLDKCDGPFGSGLKSEHYVDEGVRAIRLQNIKHGRFDDTDAAYIEETYYREKLNGHDVRAGDVLIAGLGDERNTVGRACVAPARIDPAMVKADCFRFRIDETKVTPRFTALQLTAGSEADAGSLSSGSTRSRISLSSMSTRALALPPLSEQAAIVSFLDRETAKIDALITEQQRLMELLQEKRQAVISHAVTKGLNPDAPMKPSGVEWLGDVPTHWEVKRLGRLFRQVVEPGVEELPILSVSIHHGVSDDELPEEEMDRKVTRSDDRSKYKRVEPGDLVYNMMRAWQGGFGTVSVHGMVSPAYIVARPHAELITTFVEHLLRIPQAVEQMRRHSKGVTDFRLRLYWGEFKDIQVAVPHFDEAQAICRAIAKMDENFDDLRGACELSIALLSERRSTLITAAVTGQIDVRAVEDDDPSEAWREDFAHGASHLPSTALT